MNDKRLREIIKKSKMETSNQFTYNLLMEIEKRERISQTSVLWQFKKVGLSIFGIIILLFVVIFYVLTNDFVYFFGLSVSKKIILSAVCVLVFYLLNTMSRIYEDYCVLLNTFKR